MGKGKKAVNRFQRQSPVLSQMSKEQIEHERNVQKIRLKTGIINTQREIDFKKKQVESGVIIETRTRHILPDGTSALVDAYVDGLKPEFLLLNEIDELLSRIDINKSQLQYLEDAEQRDNADNKKS